MEVDGILEANASDRGIGGVYSLNASYSRKLAYLIWSYLLSWNPLRNGEYTKQLETRYR